MFFIIATANVVDFIPNRTIRKDKIAEITRRNLSVVFVGCYHYIDTHFLSL